MQNLEPKQLAALYLLLFQIGESGLDINTQPINELLTFNDEPDELKVLFDNEGGPINATKEVYDTWNKLLEETDDYTPFTLLDIDEYEAHQTQYWLLQQLSDL